MCIICIPILNVESQAILVFHVHHISYCLESSLNITKAKGKVLVCRHAGSSTESKLAKGVEVKKAGGVGMILIDEADRDVAIPFAIPAAIVGIRTGLKILSYINTTRFCSLLDACMMLLDFLSSFSLTCLCKQPSYINHSVCQDCFRIPSCSSSRTFFFKGSECINS